MHHNKGKKSILGLILTLNIFVNYKLHFFLIYFHKNRYFMFGMASVILIIPTWSALKNHVWRMTRHDFCSYIIVLPLLSLLHTWWKKEVFGCGLVQIIHIFLALYTWSTPTFMYRIWVFQLIFVLLSTVGKVLSMTFFFTIWPPITSSIIRPTILILVLFYFIMVW